MDPRTRWDERYAGAEYVFGEEPNLFLYEQAWRLSPGSSVFAVADGEGRNGVWLAGQGHDVHTIDISEVAMAKARLLAQKRGVVVNIQDRDVRTLDWPEEAFDAVVAIFIQFASPSERQRMFEGMKTCLKPGGLLLLQGYRPEQLQYGTGGPKEEANLYTERLLEDSFGDMEILHLASEDRILLEGEAHKGVSALVSLVARKAAR
jgi:SAM-dependent methyltransferase